MTLLIDAHLDLAFNALSLDRDLTLSVEAGRQREAHRGAAWIEDIGSLTTTLEELRTHGPAVVCGTIFLLPKGAVSSFDTQAYSTPDEAAAQAREQLDWYRQQAQAGQLHMITTRAAFAAACAAEPGTPPGLVLLMEGADGLRTPDELSWWHAAGLRWLGPAWQGTRYCGGTQAPGPLTDLGRTLIATMNELQVALDISHLAEDSFWEALELARIPVAASHSNCRALLEQADAPDRFLSDAMIRAIVERDGVIGLALYNKMLDAAWDGQKHSVGLDTLVRHIEHVCNLAGDTRHVAIGSDLDGGFGREQVPGEIDSWRDLARIGDALAAHGWHSADIANVLHMNWQRWFNRILD